MKGTEAHQIQGKSFGTEPKTNFKEPKGTDREPNLFRSSVPGLNFVNSVIRLH